MEKYFVPFVDDSPFTIEVKGHLLLLASTDEEGLEADLKGLQLRNLDIQESDEDQLNVLAESINGGIVISSNELSLGELIQNLEVELPWVH